MQPPEPIRLARAIDPSYPTNRWILVVAAIAAGLGAAIAAGGGLGAAACVRAGFDASVATFLAWALCREVLPDREDVAFFAAAFGFALAVGLGPPSLLPGFAWLLTLRVASRTPGAAAGWIDTLALLGLAGWLAWRGDPVIALAVAVAMLVDGIEREPVLRHRWTAGVALAMAVGALFVAPPGAFVAPPTWTLVGAAVVSVAFGAALVVIGRPVSVGDRDGRPLDPARVVAAQVIALLGAWGASIPAGAAGLAAVGPLWAALAGASVAVWPRRR